MQRHGSSLWSMSGITDRPTKLTRILKTKHACADRCGILHHPHPPPLPNDYLSQPCCQRQRFLLRKKYMNNDPTSFQDRFGMSSSNMLDAAVLRGQSRRAASAADTARRRDQWGLLMAQVRAQLHSGTSDEFASRAIELRRLARSEAEIRDRKNFCDPPVLEAAPGYPFYATASFVSISPIRPSRTIKSSKMDVDGPSRLSVSDFGCLPSPIQQLCNVYVESLCQQCSPGQTFAYEVSTMSSNMCARFDGLPPRPIQRVTPNFGCQVLPTTKSNPYTESLCPRRSPGQILAEEILSSSSNPGYPTQLNSCRQISYSASDNHPPSQHGVLGTNEIRAASILTDIPGSNLAIKAKNTKTKRGVPKSGFVTPTELDVLAGRGGETNHHIGNMVFREEARKLRALYRMEGTSRDDKFWLSMVRCCSGISNFIMTTTDSYPHRDCFPLLRSWWSESRHLAADSWGSVTSCGTK